MLDWVHSYKQFGDDGLKRSRKQENYYFEFRLAMVESYLSSESSNRELALKNGIKNFAVIAKWVNEFRGASPDALRPRKKCRKRIKYSSYKGKVGGVASNRIRRRFNTSILHQKITTDMTVFKYYEVDFQGCMTIHKLYFDPFMAMYNGEILSFGIAKQLSAKKCVGCLRESNRKDIRLSLS